MATYDDLKIRKEEIEGLVEKIQTGNQDAFAKLYDIFIDPIYRYVYFRVNEEDAEDIVETVFLKVWENIKKYRRSDKSFSSWIFRVAHNLIIDYYRSTKDKSYHELDSRIPDQMREHNPIKVTENILHQNNLKKAISKLKKPYQDLVVYKFINEFSNKEIADILKRSEGSIRILQYRALKELKRELEEMGIKYLA